MEQYDPESYYKLNVQGIEIFFQMDAYFMVSGLSKLTIDLSHSTHGDLLTIREFDLRFN